MRPAFREERPASYRYSLVELQIPGRHNVANGLAAILVGLALGLDFKKIARSIRGFTGAKRRFHLRADSGGVMLIDDYAHHPTEIRAVLAACRNWIKSCRSSGRWGTRFSPRIKAAQ